MPKTSPIPDDAHEIVRNQQKELKRKHKIIIRISDLIALYIKDGAKRTEKLLGIKSEEEKIAESNADSSSSHIVPIKDSKSPGVAHIKDEDTNT